MAEGGRRIRGEAGRTGRSPRVVVGRGEAGDGATERERSRRENGAFVDARLMPSEDIVSRTLTESSGSLGLATRPKVVDFTARLRERRRAGRRAVALRILTVLAVLAVLAGIVWTLLFSPLLRLRMQDVTVDGANGWVSERQVRDIVAGQRDTSLLLVDVSSLRSGLTGIPGVTKAEVHRRFPHGLAVTITAQRPAAMLRTERGATAVDVRGRVLNAVSGTSDAGVPVIDVRDVDAALRRKGVREALKVLDSLPESLRGRVTRTTADTQDSVRTELDGGARSVVWGNGDDMALKIAVVERLLDDADALGDRKEIDVSAPRHPVLR